MKLTEIIFSNKISKDVPKAKRDSDDRRHKGTI